MARTHVILPDDLVDEIDTLVGKRKRSEFIADAAEKELKRRRRIAAARQAGGSLRDAETPPEWASHETAAEWVRSIRRWPDHWNDERADADQNSTAS